MSPLDELIRYGESFLGRPYIWGSWDCSHFCVELLKSHGMLGFNDYLTAQGLFNRYQAAPRALERGSLMFFGASPASIEHVALATNQWSMLECGGGDHTTLTIQDALLKDARVRRRGTRSRLDLYCSVLPKYPWDK